MSYTYTAVVPLSWADAVEKTRAALATQGFGILSEIDVRATFAAKLGDDGRCEDHVFGSVERLRLPQPQRQRARRTAHVGHAIDNDDLRGG